MSAGISATLPIFLLPIVTAYLSPQEYGRVAVFQVISGVISAIIGMALHEGCKRNVVGINSNKLSNFISDSFIIITIMSGLLLVIIFTIPDSLFERFNLDKSWLYASVILGLSGASIQLRLSIWQMYEAVVKHSILSAKSIAIRHIFGLIFIMVFSNSSNSYIFGMTAAISILGIYSFISIYSDGLIVKPFAEREATTVLLKFSIPLMPHILGALLLTLVDRAVIAEMLGSEAAGIYLAAMQIGMLYSVLFMAMNNAYVPWLYKLLTFFDKRSFRKLITFVSTGYLILILIGLLGARVTEYLAQEFLSSEYIVAKNLMWTITWGHIFSGAYLMSSSVLFYYGKSLISSSITVTLGLINFVLVIILTKTHGLIGATYAFLFIMFLRWIITTSVALMIFKNELNKQANLK